MNDLNQSTTLTISLLGGFQVKRVEQPAVFATNRARALLAYLAVEANQPHPREALAALFWPDDQEQSARQNLRQTLTRVRQATGDHDADPAFMQITRSTLQLNWAAPITVDLLAFQQLVAACADHSDLVRCDACMERLATAVELYQGPFLDGTQFADSACFEEWVLMTRQQTQRQALDALDTLTTHYANKGNHQRAQQYAARQLEIEPWRESAHRQLMTALVDQGQRAAALAQFEECHRLLATELAVEPEEATIRLAEQIRAGDFRDTAVTPSPPHLVIPSSSRSLRHPQPPGSAARPNPLRRGDSTREGHVCRQRRGSFVAGLYRWHRRHREDNPGQRPHSPDGGPCSNERCHPPPATKTLAG